MVPAEPAPGPGQVVCARQHQPAAKWAAAGPVQRRFTRAGIPAELLPAEPACGCQGAHGRPGRLGIAAADPRPGDQARLLNVLRSQGVEISRADKAFSAAVLNVESAAIGGPVKAAEEKKAAADEKAAADSKLKEAPTTTTQHFPAGSYIIRMDQPYSRLADTLLDTQYFSTKDPRPYDDTGWTLGALANVKTVRVTDTSVLDVPMAKLTGELRVAGDVKGAGHTTYLVNNNADSALATFRFRLAS